MVPQQIGQCQNNHPNTDGGYVPVSVNGGNPQYSDTTTKGILMWVFLIYVFRQYSDINDKNTPVAMGIRRDSDNEMLRGGDNQNSCQNPWVYQRG